MVNVPITFVANLPKLWLTFQFCGEPSCILIFDDVHVDTDRFVNYSLFHQILGVAFFQFTKALFKIFQQNLSRLYFHLPLNLVLELDLG